MKKRGPHPTNSKSKIGLNNKFHHSSHYLTKFVKTIGIACVFCNYSSDIVSSYLGTISIAKALCEF